MPVAPEDDEPSALSEWKEESEKQSRLNHVRVYIAMQQLSTTTQNCDGLFFSDKLFQ